MAKSDFTIPAKSTSAILAKLAESTSTIPAENDLEVEISDVLEIDSIGDFISITEKDAAVVLMDGSFLKNKDKDQTDLDVNGAKIDEIVSAQIEDIVDQVMEIVDPELTASIIMFNENPRTMICQQDNGPCALIALFNCLSLQGRLTINNCLSSRILKLSDVINVIGKLFILRTGLWFGIVLTIKCL